MSKILNHVTELGLSDLDVTRRPCDLAAVTHPGQITPAKSQPRDLATADIRRLGTVISMFPGIDMLGMGFEQAGYTLLRGPDLIFGGDIRAFNPPPGAATGVIGGTPCQEFSKLLRTKPTGYSAAMVHEFIRIVQQVKPEWWLLENVPTVPDVKIFGYSWQRLDLRASEFGLKQSRLRHFQFGSRTGQTLILPRRVTTKATEPCCLASEGQRTNRRSWADFCELQGLPRDFDLPSFTRQAKYRAVGNGVPVPMAYAVAHAIANPQEGTPCACSCGRPITGKQTYATAACRKRAQRRRDVAANVSTRQVTGKKTT